MDNNFLRRSISDHYDAHSTFETFQYINYSEKVSLYPSTNCDNELDQAKKYALMPKGERTLIWFINHFEEDKNRSVVNVYNNIYNCTTERKISNPQVKVLRAKVKKLTPVQLAYYKTFNGVIELETDKLQRKSKAKKLSNIHTLYTAKIPYDIAYDAIVDELSAHNVRISKQDLIAFLSLALAKRYRNYLSISSSVWEPFFGRRNIKVAKSAFEKLGLFTLDKKGLPSFRATRFKLRTDVELYNEFTEIKITSIRTLEKICRIKCFKHTFSLPDKIVALKILYSLNVKRFLSDLSMGKCIPFSYFLDFIEDLEDMQLLIEDDIDNEYAQKFANHLLIFIKNANENNFGNYEPYNRLNQSKLAS